LNLDSKESKLIFLFTLSKSGIKLLSTKVKHKRSKTTVIMLLPGLIFIAIIGWCMYCIGDQKRVYPKGHKIVEKDNVTIMPMIYQEKQDIINQ
jgi:hypothetical protein